MTKLELVKKYIIDKICDGDLIPGDRAPSEYELARILNLNKSTANKAVTSLVQEGILLRGKQGSGTFVKQSTFKGRLMFIATIKNPFFAEMVNGAQQTALAYDYIMQLCAPPPELLEDFLNKINKKVSLGILTATYMRLSHEPQDIPIIYLNNEFKRDKQPKYLINSDGAMGTRLTTEEMLNKNHRNIVYYGQQRAKSRSAGFIEAMRKNGITDAEERVFYYESNSSSSFHMLRKFQERFPGFTGIVTDSDDVSYHLVIAGKKQGINIPGDISITGFGNIKQICELFELTSINQHQFEQGANACKKLIEIIEGTSEDTEFDELTEVELIRRNSVKDIRQ